MELKDKHKKIIEKLKDGKLATTKIAFLIFSNLYQTQVYLKELEEQNLIKSNKKNNATYWSLNGLPNK